jgi:hypothetical protein
MKADKIVTGHNADDIAETVLMNRKTAARLRLRLFCFESQTLTTALFAVCAMPWQFFGAIPLACADVLTL